jgi:hypothetical protein
MNAVLQGMISLRRKMQGLRMSILEIEVMRICKS